jgi:broad specificity phosphatase PhoE
MRIAEFLLWLGGILLALLMLVACSTAPEAAPARAEPAFYVMRHLHKADGPDPALSPQGVSFAQRLPALFAGRSKPVALYVSSTRRARETAAPLAAALRITPREYDPADTAALLARVRAEPGPVLIVGHSNTVPDIVAGLGGTRPAPLADTDYGTVWMISGNGATEPLAL